MPAVSHSPIRPPMMALRDNTLSAFRGLVQNRLRSTLTMSGIIVGVMAIVTLIAILQGVKTEVARQVEGLGANLVMIIPGKTDFENMGQPNMTVMLGLTTFTDKDVELLQQVPGVAQISPVIFASTTLETSRQNVTSAMIVGTNREGVLMNPTPLAEGRYFRKDEEDRKLVVLGYKARKELFGNKPVLGRKVRIENKEWEVVGVLSKPEDDGTLGNAMLGLSDLCYLPDRAVRREIKDRPISRIALRLAPEASTNRGKNSEQTAERLINQLEQTLLKSHNGREDFTLLTQKKGVAMVFKLINMAQQLLLLIAAISLFVAGIGIMNIMLVSVTERTREIGIRKTVGARSIDIFFQFLTEAIVLSLVGGVLGLGLSWVICALVDHYSALTPEITPGLIGLAFAVCGTVGVLFGVTPAVRAARLDPINALRHE